GLGIDAKKGFRDLKVYRMAYATAMEIFEVSKKFPSEERYSRIDQMRRSSRSVAANIAEGYRKRFYPKLFILKMTDADGEATETQVWLDMAHDCGYLCTQQRDELRAKYEVIGRMLGGMIAHPERFAR